MIWWLALIAYLGVGVSATVVYRILYDASGRETLIAGIMLAPVWPCWILVAWGLLRVGVRVQS